MAPPPWNMVKVGEAMLTLCFAVRDMLAKRGVPAAQAESGSIHGVQHDWRKMLGGSFQNLKLKWTHLSSVDSRWGKEAEAKVREPKCDPRTGVNQLVCFLWDSHDGVISRIQIWEGIPSPSCGRRATATVGLYSCQDLCNTLYKPHLPHPDDSPLRGRDEGPHKNTLRNMVCPRPQS